MSAPMHRQPRAEEGIGLIAMTLGLLAGATWLLAWTSAELLSHIQRFDNDVAISDVGRVRDLITNGPTSVWPGINIVAFAAFTMIQITILVFLVVAVISTIRTKFRPPSQEGESIALLRSDDRIDAWDVDPDTARRLEPHLPQHGTLTPTQKGVVLGGIRKNRRSDRLALADREGTIVCIMAPRAGKTSAYAVGATLAAPGAVCVTSSKSDIVEHTAAIRAQLGQIWIFDPQQLATGTAPTWWWDPLTTVTNYETAYGLASQLIEKPAEQKDAFWVDSARDLFALLLLAAICDPRHDIRTVARWLDSDLEEPVALLLHHGRNVEAASLERVVIGANDTVAGILQTVKSATSWLRSETVVEWLHPHHDKPALDMHQLVTSRDTLFMLSKEGRGSVGPLLTAMTAAALDAGLAAARQQPNGRLEVPMTCVLDEAANIARIQDLPSYYSYAGSAGIVLMTFLQSFAQGRSVWGNDGMTALWTASTHRVVGPGLAQARDCEDLSKIIGTTRQYRSSETRGRNDQRNSTSSQWHEQPIISPGEVAGLSPGTALLLGAGRPPVHVDQRPWYLGDRAAEIKQGITKDLSHLVHRTHTTAGAT